MASPTLIWVCVDCMFDHHGFTEQDMGQAPPEGLWSNYEDQDVDITPGMLREEHEEDCDPEDECGCEQIDFTWSACNACGSTLGGSREAFTVWHRGEIDS
jgi:hypothetical protein